MGEMVVLRGKKNHKDVGHVLTFNGDPGISNSQVYSNNFERKK